MVLDTRACLILWNIFKNTADFKHVLVTLIDILSIIRPVRPIKSERNRNQYCSLQKQFRVVLLFFGKHYFLSGSTS